MVFASPNFFYFRARRYPDASCSMASFKLRPNFASGVGQNSPGARRYSSLHPARGAERRRATILAES
jgi:hypothetical protein